MRKGAVSTAPLRARGSAIARSVRSDVGPPCRGGGWRGYLAVGTEAARTRWLGLAVRTPHATPGALHVPSASDPSPRAGALPQPIAAHTRGGRHCHGDRHRGRRLREAVPAHAAELESPG